MLATGTHWLLLLASKVRHKAAPTHESTTKILERASNLPPRALPTIERDYHRSCENGSYGAREELKPQRHGAHRGKARS